MEMFNPPHPGEIILEDFLKPLNLSVEDAAKKLDLSPAYLADVVNGKSPISPEMALKLSKSIGTTARFWLNMQQAYDLWQAKQRVNLDNVEVIAL